MANLQCTDIQKLHNIECLLKFSIKYNLCSTNEEKRYIEPPLVSRELISDCCVCNVKHRKKVF